MCGDCSCKPFMGCHVHHHGRRFLTKEEKIKLLENYADELEKELQQKNVLKSFTNNLELASTENFEVE